MRVLIAFVAALALASAVDGRSADSVFPKPQKASFGASTVQVDCSLHHSEFFGRHVQVMETFQAHSKRFHGFICRDTRAADINPNVPVARSVDIRVADPHAQLRLGVDESYSLTVDADGRIVLTAATPFGAVYGLDTLAQLVTFNSTDGTSYIHDAPIAIEDSPRFAWRGFLVDTARHYLRVRRRRPPPH